MERLDVKNVEKISPRDPWVIEQVAKGWKDTRVYAKTFYPDRFSLSFSGLHDELFAAIDAKNEKGEPLNKKIVIKAFRGFGKTSVAKTLVSKSIRYQDHHLIVYIGKSHDWAAVHTEAVKNSMLMNRLENKVFGSIRVGAANRDVQETFSKKAWVATQIAGYREDGEPITFGCMVVPRGIGQPVRGLVFDWELATYRPSLIIIDDLEVIKLLDNEETRQENYLWFLGDVIEAKPLEGVSTNWQIIFIDTFKHEDSVHERLMEAEDWFSIDLPLCDENYKSLAPDFVSDKAIMLEVEEHKKKNTLDVFYQEKMGLPVGKGNARFQMDYFKYYNECDKEFLDNKAGLVTGVILDPAKTTHTASAESGFVVFSVNVHNPKIYIRHAQGYMLHPEEIYEKAFELAQRFGALAIGYEETSLNEFIRYPLTDAMIRRGFHFTLVPLKSGAGAGTSSAEFSGRMGRKKARIAALIPYYREGLVYHNEVGTSALEVQLLSFPKSKKWDVMDAASYIIKMLDEGDIFMMPEFYNSEDGSYDIENEYKELETQNEPTDDVWMTV